MRGYPTRFATSIEKGAAVRWFILGKLKTLYVTSNIIFERYIKSMYVSDIHAQSLQHMPPSQVKDAVNDNKKVFFTYEDVISLKMLDGY